MITALWSIFGLLILLGVLVTFHEWGHYWVAKKLGVKAQRFSVGFGKPIWSRFNKHGTDLLEILLLCLVCPILMLCFHVREY